MNLNNNETIVTAKLADVKYLTTITSGNKHIIGDEPKELGGNDKGFNPYELLASALSMCTAATLRMYADRKEWNLGEINVTVKLSNEATNKTARFIKHISFENKNIDEKDLKRLKAIADACPVNKLLTNNIVVESHLE